MTAVYVDTSVLLVAAGAPSPARDTCVAFLAPVADLHAARETAQRHSSWWSLDTLGRFSNHMV